MVDGGSISCVIALSWISVDLIDGKSTFISGNTWWHYAYVLNRSQWVKNSAAESGPFEGIEIQVGYF